MGENLNLFFSVLVGGGQVWEQHVDCREGLRTACQQQSVGLTLSRDAGTGVDRSRNRQVEIMRAMNAAETDPAKRYTHFMFCDADVLFTPQHVINMMRSDLDIVAAIYPRKAIDYDLIEAAVKKGVPTAELPLYSTSFIFNHWKGKGITNSVLGTFVEVEEVGTGFLMIKAEVIEKFIAQYKDDIAYTTDYPPRDVTHHMVFAGRRDPDCAIEKATAALKAAAKIYTGSLQPATHTALIDAVLDYQDALDKPPGRYLTEDYSFCRLARQMGYKLYAYIDAPLGHMGSHCFHGDVRKGLDLKVTTDEVKEQAGEMVLVQDERGDH